MESSSNKEEPKQISSTKVSPPSEIKSTDTSTNNKNKEEPKQISSTKVSSPSEIKSTDTSTNNKTTNGIDKNSILNDKLHRKWVFWFDNPKLADPNMSWKENLKNCGSFDTPELFWRIFNNMKPTSQLPVNSNYHIFREGIEPMWEDPENMNGGKFVLTVPKKESRQGKADELFLKTLLAVIGETIDATGDIVCGTVVSTRKSQDRIALWLKSDREEICIPIGEKWKKAMDIPPKMSIKYQLHKEAAAAGHSFKNEIMFEV